MAVRDSEKPVVPKRIGRCYELAGKVMTGRKPEANRFTLERALRATNCALASSSAAAWPSGAQVGGLAEDAEQRPEKAHVCRAGRAVRLCGPSPARPEALHDFTHILSLLVGALLGLRFTVYVLVVVIYFATAVIGGVGAAGEVDAWWISLDIAVGATALQMGYLEGAQGQVHRPSMTWRSGRPMQTLPRRVRGLGRIWTLWRLARGEVSLQSRGEVSLQF